MGNRLDAQDKDVSFLGKDPVGLFFPAFALPLFRYHLAWSFEPSAALSWLAMFEKAEPGGGEGLDVAAASLPSAVTLFFCCSAPTVCC